MASEDALLGSDFKVQLGDGDSPPTYEDLCAATNFGSIGEDKPLVEVTSYCDSARAYRNGLADGVEISMECNYIPGDTQTAFLYAAYQNDEVVKIRIVEKAGSPLQGFEFNAVVRAWNIAGTVGERATLTFTLKVSGSVLWRT